MFYVAGSLALLFYVFCALMLFGCVATCARLSFRQACALLVALVAVFVVLYLVTRTPERSHVALAILASVFVVEQHTLSAVIRKLKLDKACRRERAKVIGETFHPSRKALSLSHLRSFERAGTLPCVVRKLYHVTTERRKSFAAWYAGNICKETASAETKTVTSLVMKPISERERAQLETLRAHYMTELERSKVNELLALARAEKQLDSVRLNVRTATAKRIKRVTLTNKAGRKNRVRYYAMPAREASLVFSLYGSEKLERKDYTSGNVVNVSAMFPRLLSADWKTKLTTLTPKLVTHNSTRLTFAETRKAVRVAVDAHSKDVATIKDNSKAERTVLRGTYMNEAKSLAVPVHVSTVRNTFTLDKSNQWLRKYINKMYAEHNGGTSPFSSHVVTYDAQGTAHVHNVNALMTRDEIGTVQSPVTHKHYLRFSARDVEQESLLILWQSFLKTGKLPTDEQCKAVARDMFNEMYRNDKRNIGLDVLANMADPATL